MQFVGVSEKNYLAKQNIMNEVAYNKVCGVGGAAQCGAPRRSLVEAAMYGDRCPSACMFVLRVSVHNRLIPHPPFLSFS